jgi:hypothetical protein
MGYEKSIKSKWDYLGIFTVFTGIFNIVMKSVVYETK